MVNYKRVNKATARKLYNNGINILLLPCKVSDSAVYGSHPWLKPISISLLSKEYPMNIFDRSVNEYEYYNCNAELGYYAHYFVSEEDIELQKMCDLMCK